MVADCMRFVGFGLVSRIDFTPPLMMLICLRKYDTNFIIVIIIIIIIIGVKLDKGHRYEHVQKKQ